MGKRGKGGNILGKSLIRDRFGARKVKRNSNEPSMLHTSEINDGYDWGRLNLQSVTEESSFQEFLATAELAGTEFQAEKLNVRFVNSKSGLLTKAEQDKILKSQKENRDLLKIPRRPKWDSSTTAQELLSREKETFLQWRRSLAELQDTEGILLTPFEKNLEFWRQLWRVVERSDVVVQIVDARNPLLFRCEDLECYVKEVNGEKLNMILINKADFLTNEQREAWAKYFADINVRVAFFSALLSAEKIKEEENEDEVNSNDKNYEDDRTDEEESETDESVYNSEFMSESEYESADDNSDLIAAPKTETEKEKRAEAPEDALERLRISATGSENGKEEIETTINSERETGEKRVVNSSELLNRGDLIELLKTIYKGETHTKGVTTIGLVGYPNVGKSSTINALLMDKKVSVSATPGKTKHFQTLYLDTDLMLCDCPGLVTPSFISTKAEMILNGILPIDQMRDHVPPVTLLTTLIPRHILEDLYGLILPVPSEKDTDRPLNTDELLNAHGYNRGFMTQNGQPDNARSARYVLKDFVNGRLLYCVAPPTREQEHFHAFPPRRRLFSANRHIPPRAVRVNKGSQITEEEFNRMFFRDISSGVHMKGALGGRPVPQRSLSTVAESKVGSTQSLSLHEKPWKLINKHANKKKREKGRRLYAHLDQH
ncbi:PREDICTED: large subunit GTPase 1 homolog [Dinoponera quadriceps]|uniref:Large subunit GTPase 1 homolog n=1 Tax=Dinoponera quadriceps TaxID=609295 RepID=A0A6P3XMJ3_DINQU|nr:PREDICTED: large subunit GTPase 1 homolog [Dinoponera quadriceps]